MRAQRSEGGIEWVLRATSLNRLVSVFAGHSYLRSGGR